MYFAPDTNWNGITTFDYVAKDDQGVYSAVAGTATINITAVNDDPVIAFGEGNKSYTENNTPIIIDALAALSDVDLVDFNGGVLDVRVTANGSGSDRIEIRNEGMSATQVGMITGPNEVYYSGGIDRYPGPAVALHWQLLSMRQQMLLLLKQLSEISRSRTFLIRLRH